MLILISPAKNLDFESPLATKKHSQPDFLKQSQTLIDDLRELKPDDISALMKISPKLGELNWQRYADFSTPFTTKNARPAVLAFNGDVYSGLEAETFSAADFDFAQDHLRILSGLYGLLRPLDLMQPYRLEMGTKFAPDASDAKNLYGFWDNQITDAVNAQLKSVKSETVVNLASNEYYKSVKPKQLDAQVITPVFKDLKNGNYKIISFYAKKARGLMASHIIRNKLTDAGQLEGFNSAGYYYSAEHSTATELTFLRDEPA